MSQPRKTKCDTCSKVLFATTILDLAWNFFMVVKAVTFALLCDDFKLVVRPTYAVQVMNWHLNSSGESYPVIGKTKIFIHMLVRCNFVPRFHPNIPSFDYIIQRNIKKWRSKTAHLSHTCTIGLLSSSIAVVTRMCGTRSKRRTIKIVKPTGKKGFRYLVGFSPWTVCPSYCAF